MLRRRDIRAFQLGGRRQWRIERAELEAYIQHQYAEVEQRLRREPGGKTTDQT